jgi:hypothetical protein
MRCGVIPNMPIRGISKFEYTPRCPGPRMCTCVYIYICILYIYIYIYIYIYKGAHSSDKRIEKNVYDFISQRIAEIKPEAVSVQKGTLYDI